MKSRSQKILPLSGTTKTSNRKAEASRQYTTYESDCSVISTSTTSNSISSADCLSPPTWTCDELRPVCFGGEKKSQKKQKSMNEKIPQRISTINLEIQSDTRRPRGHRKSIDSENSDEEVDEIISRLSRQSRARQISTDDDKKERVVSPISNAGSSVPSFNTTRSASTSHQAVSSKIGGTVEYTGDPKITAPNVGKLPPASVVELRLQSGGECVVVQCSVDVLKMRSAFFQEILAEQELSKPLNSTAPNTVNWRAPVTIEETSPFEAAAFLESLHEGRTLFKSEWNICWARLSVNWGIDDLMLEYANHIESHINKLITTIQTHHWRTNPNILTGMKIAVLRKGPTPTPTIVLGSCVEATPSTGYSKIRVSFDVEKSPINHSSDLRSPLKQETTDWSFPSPSKADYPQSPTFLSQHNKYEPGSSFESFLLTQENSGSPLKTREYLRSSFHKTSINQTTILPAPSFEGDIGEPFWVKYDKEGASWVEPDDLFNQNSKKIITLTDKRMFWEMIEVIIQLPQIATLCKSGIRLPKELVSILKRRENRILWTSDGPDCLPKDLALELIKAAFT